MVDAKGNRVGDVTLASHTDGVRLTGDLHDLPPGTHGTHIHSVGRCDPPDFKSAGDHFNPAAKQHGDQNPQGAHAGDLGNITIGQDGKGQFEAIAKGVTIEAGAASLARPGGTSLVIHAREDDRKSDPSGNSGERIACGVFASASGGPR
ncbi:MAG TPA: superoxide dismutase family protein [Beijerinckiaceae bacterium]|nr:superoxide dismutase family protein [Beijerinckiaceae bacterium]